MARQRLMDCGAPGFLTLVILSGCAQEEPLSPTKPTGKTSSESVLLSETEIARIREAVEHCGGALRVALVADK